MRYWDKDDLSKKFRELAHYIAIADDNNAPQPKMRIIWVIADHDHLDEKIFDEIEQLLERGISGIRCKYAISSNHLYSQETWRLAHLPGLNKFFYHLNVQDYIWENIVYLYHMLDADEFEHLVAYLLQAHPTAEDITKEDYVLSLFVEHEKKKRNLKE